MYFDVDTLGRILAAVHDPRRTHPARTLVIDALLPLYGAIHLANFVGEKLDAIRHPEIDAMDVGQPIYIVAAPRSGTTFLHRLMSLDPRFATFTLYQTIFPTVAASELAERARSSRTPVAKITEVVEHSLDESFGGWEGVHDTGLGADEEDEAIWAMSMATPAIFLLIPHPKEFPEQWYVDRLPEAKRRRLVETYERALKARRFRHPDKTLLLKNVLLPSRYGLVLEAAPRARFVHIVRHPYEVIPSALSLFTMPWTVVAPHDHGPSRATTEFADLLIEYYRFFYDREREAAASGDDRFVSMRYRDLMDDPIGQLRRVYTRFDLPLRPEVEARFRAELSQKGEFKSGHAYSLEQFGLTREYIADKLGDVMEHYGFEK